MSLHDDGSFTFSPAAGQWGDDSFEYTAMAADGASATATVTITVTPTSIALDYVGFVIEGETGQDYAGFSVAAAGDVNGDGIDDLILGAPDAQGTEDPRAGRAYVVFGRDDLAGRERGPRCAG